MTTLQAIENYALLACLIISAIILGWRIGGVINRFSKWVAGKEDCGK